MLDPQVDPPGVQGGTPSQSDSDAVQTRYSEPKLTFVKPELVSQGQFSDVTGQFFGTFFP